MSQQRLTAPNISSGSDRSELLRQAVSILGAQRTTDGIVDALLHGCIELTSSTDAHIILGSARRVLRRGSNALGWQNGYDITGHEVSAHEERQGGSSRTRIIEADGSAAATLTVFDPANDAEEELELLCALAGSLLAAVEKRASVEALRRTRRDSEAELEDIEAFVADAQSISRTGSWMWNPTDPAIGEWSIETYKMLDYDPERVEASFENNFARVHPEDRERYLAEVTAAAIEQKDLDVQYRYLLPDGTVRHVHARGRRLSPTLYIGTANDITQRRLAEAAVRTAQTELASASRLLTLGELVTSMSHELNQPLAAVVANAGAAKRWLLKEPPDVESAKESIDLLIDDAKRAQSVVDSLRSLARRSDPERRSLDLNDAIREILPLARSELRSRHTDLMMELAEDPPLLLADRVQVQQVVLTLLLTSLDQAVPGLDRSLAASLQTFARGDRVVIAVDGAGKIDPCLLERQVSPEDLIGHRLAMIVCRSIVEAHGGRLILLDGVEENSRLEAEFPNFEAADLAGDAVA